MGVIRLFVCARATLHQWIGLGEKPPKMPGFARCAQVEAELRVAKKRLSQAAMRREAEGGEGWFESMRCARTDHFIPLAYESNGEWGTRAKEFFKLVCEIAGTEGTRSADCYHWSAMTYGRHWRHRVAVILGRGRVTCLRRSADKGFGGSDVFTAEVAPDSL